MKIINKRKYAIGVFDSGLGGLTVVKELIKQLPNEHIVYFGDTARVPYGTKSLEAIIRFSKENVHFLLKHKVKMIVVACNSSSSLALPTLRKEFSLPIIGVIEPGAKKACETTKNRRIGVIATSATIQSQKYVRMIKKILKKAIVSSQACPLFVPLVEEGWFSDRITRDIAKKYLSTMIQSKIDTLILGCTHYPLLKEIIGSIMGKKVFLVDSAKEVAEEVAEALEKMNLANRSLIKGNHRFFVSDKPQHFRSLAKRFLGYDIKNIRKV
ncbi:MAG: glutamate racemase [Candidatus Omnitrophica bacterium]|nr:glutamate racemase [Candidatus Omnitrophota bacterium]